ncbi:MAG: hypothetical protein V3V85_06915 [Candidatus Thorarchaeota archaeon]
MSEEKEGLGLAESVDTGKVENASPEPEADAETQGSEAESTPAVSTDEEKPDRFGDRIKELTDKVRSGKQTSEAEKFELRQEIERLQGQLKDRPAVQEPLKTLEDFEFDESKHREYLDQRYALIAENAASDAVGKVQTQLESGQIEHSFRAREVAFESTVDDYEDVVYGEINGQRKWAASPEMVDELRLSEIGPEMTYHLAKNPEIASEITALSPRETVRRMTLLEADLKSEKAKTGKSVSDAPPPPPTLPAGDKGLEKDPADMSDKEFAKWRGKQIANR